MRDYRSVLVLLAIYAMAIPVRGQDVAAARDVALAIEINVPAFRLDVLADTQVIRSFDIAVGMRRYPTPMGDFTISDVQWNPWWTPPDSPWAEKDTVTPPGHRNPMGKVKLPLGSLLFVHGTPLSESIGKAASHACIRMRNTDAIALARLVQASGGATMSDATLDSLLQRWEPSRHVALQFTIPVRIVYELVERRGDELVFHPDVYRRGRADVIARALSLISAAGYDTAQVNRDRLESIAGQGAAARTSVKFAQLFPAVMRPQGSSIPEVLHLPRSLSSETAHTMRATPTPLLDALSDLAGRRNDQRISAAEFRHEDKEGL